MSTKEKITTDIKNAMKAKDSQLLSVLRMMLSEIKYAQAAVNVQQELPEDEVLKIVGNYGKKLEKSLADYPEGEKKQAIQQELEIVARYLPAKASRADVEKIVADVLSSTNDRQFGALMKAVMAKIGGAADGKVISEVLKAKLS